jgi:parallel beta-helix repeat protein
MQLRCSGGAIWGMVLVLVAFTIPFSLSAATVQTARGFCVPGERLVADGRASACIPIPECSDFQVSFEESGHRLEARLVETARIREQRIALYEILSPFDRSGSIDVRLDATGVTGDFCVDAGPLTQMCNRTLVGYGIAPSVNIMDGPGTVIRCQNLNDCRLAAADILLITGHFLYSSTYVDSLAGIWAQRMGLNTAVMDVAAISLYSPVEIRDFIADLYNTSSAEHFGDGRLGFVVLLGDAYENDNLTPMVPDYDGYGGDAQASDHFYACIVGPDDFEDVMLGRIPAGTEQELRNYYRKLASYSPLPTQAWTKSWLLAGGCYFAQKQDYVVYFDSLETYMPDEFKVSRFYRHDFPKTDLGDAQACQAMLDSLSAGKLFLFYSGDGDKWDWGGRFERTFRSDLVDDLDNADRLPIVLSISCSNGWFDNIVQAYKDGGYDCFAERLLNQPDRGAIACLASSREAGGNATTVFAPEIVKSAYVNGSSFLGELILEAKTRHLAKLGQVILVRQFNLFGDPCINFVLNAPPMAAPDLLIRPYSVQTGSEYPVLGKPLEIDYEIWNAGGVSVDEFSVCLYEGCPDSGGTPIDTCVCRDLWGWEKRQLSFVIEDAAAGGHTYYLAADDGDEIDETDESNNLTAVATYIYPFQQGYPIKMGGEVKGELIADLDADGALDILTTSGGTYAAALNMDGSVLWVKNDLGLPAAIGGVEPAAFDLNGDGATEAVLTTKSSVLVARGADGATIWQRYTDYPAVSPLITDLDGDSGFEILLGTYDYMFSSIHAFSASGSFVWSLGLPTYKERLTGMVACDYDLDGYKDVIYSTDDGDVVCLRCNTAPPSTEWDEHISNDPITCLAAADMDRDGTIEVIAAGGNKLYFIDACDGDVADMVQMPVTIDNLAIGDIDGDVDLEVVCTSATGRVVAIDGSDISMDVATEYHPVGSPVLADIDQDGVNEIIVAMEEGRIRIIRPTGQNYIAPVPMKGLCRTGPVTQDFDRDGNIEILAGSSDSLLFVLDMGIPGGRVDWLCKGGTSLRSGLYAQPVFGTIEGSLPLSGRVDAVGDVVVAPAGTLVLERGSDVRFVCDDASPIGSSPGKCEIQVFGSMVAAGGSAESINLRPIAYPSDRDDWMGILLKPGSSATLTGTNLWGAVTGIECMTSDAYISECSVTDCTVGLKVTQAAPLIDHNEIAFNNYGISTNQAPAIIVANEIAHNRYAGVILSTSSNALLEENTIRNTTQGHGISCYSSTPSILGGNRIHNNSMCGIYLSNSSPVVDSCWIAFNADCGVKAAYYSNPVVSKTTIAENRVGVAAYVYANPILGDTLAMLGGLNDIRQNSQYALYNTTGNTIKAQRTWWGSDPPNPAAFLGHVDYSGWLSTSPAGIDDPGIVTFDLRAYPNPFSHRVMLSLSAEAGRLPLEMSIYDVRGRLVRGLTRITEPGAVMVVWDGRDSFGNPVASGTYYLAVRSPKALRTTKLLYIR